MYDEISEYYIDQITEVSFELGLAESKIRWNKERGVYDPADVQWYEEVKANLDKLIQDFDDIRGEA